MEFTEIKLWSRQFIDFDPAVSQDFLEEMSEVKESYNSEHEERVRAEGEAKEVCNGGKEKVDAMESFWFDFFLVVLQVIYPDTSEL